MKGGPALPWVAASGVTGLQSVTVLGIKPGSYRVTLTFCKTNPGEASFQVSVSHSATRQSVKLGKEFVSQVQTWNGVKSSGDITIQLSANAGPSQLSGLELIRED